MIIPSHNQEAHEAKTENERADFRRAEAPAGDPSIVAASLEILDQGVQLLESLTDDAYATRLPTAFNASIGGHYRHCLDHFHGIVMATGTAVVDYDDRRRDPLMEWDRFAALNETLRLRRAVVERLAGALGREVEVICKTSYAARGSQRARATLGRELMYAVAHAVHHYALIGIIAKLQGVTLPSEFGVAPSTIKHQQEATIAGGT